MDHASDRLRDLIAECLERHDAGGEPALETFLALHPAEAPRIQKHLEDLRATGLLQPRAGTPDRESFPERLGDFRLLHRIGGGGMGVVYAAIQESLQREVAVKVIRPEHLYFAGARERFRREVESVARLQHPGIVPAYVVGESHGLPFFAMELVRGKSLAEVILSLQGAELRTLTASALRNVVGSGSSAEQVDLGRSWVEAALRIVLQVAEALGHAHERGVLHRDVKPSNVMVTPAGRALLLDFGLAAIEGAQGLTRTGHNVGSLPYMAPEQVLGQSADVGPWTDVYALGVTMYELLTLKSPFLAASSDATRARILSGEAPPPRVLNPAIPWDVETVCMKAMRRAQRQRYQSALELAADLRNFLDLRPVVATRPGAADRVRTWVRQHPIKTLVGVAAIAAVIAVPAAYAIQGSFARDRIQNALAQSEANFQRAQTAVEELLKEVGSRQLRDVPQMDKVRARLLERASAHYQALLHERPQDPGLLTKASGTAQALGEALQRLGRLDEAEQQMRRGLELAKVHQQTAPGPAAQRLIAESRHALGYLANTRADSAAAVTELTEAIGLYRELYKAQPQDADLAAVMADAFQTLSAAQIRAGRIDRAQVAIERARDLLADLVNAAPERFEFREKLANAWHTLGKLHQLGGQYPLAHSALERALELYGGLPAARRSEGQIRMAEAITWRSLGDVLTEVATWDEAKRALRRSLELRRELVADHPDAPAYRRDLAVLCIDLGEKLSMRGQPDEAGTHADEAITLLAALVDQFGKVAEYRSHLGNAWLQRARVLSAQGHRERAVEAFATARRKQEEAIELAPQDPSYGIRWSVTVGALGECLLGTGDHGGAARALQEAIAKADEVMARIQAPIGFQRMTERRRAQLADALLAGGDTARAEEVATTCAAGDRAQRLVAAGILARVAGARSGTAADAAATRAIELLRELAATDRADIDRDAPAFAALRGRPGFDDLFR